MHARIFHLPKTQDTPSHVVSCSVAVALYRNEATSRISIGNNNRLVYGRSNSHAVLCRFVSTKGSLTLRLSDARLKIARVVSSSPLNIDVRLAVKVSRTVEEVFYVQVLKRAIVTYSPGIVKRR